jgi:hypothetical protein
MHPDIQPRKKRDVLKYGPLLLPAIEATQGVVQKALTVGEFLADDPVWEDVHNIYTGEKLEIPVEDRKKWTVMGCGHCRNWCAQHILGDPDNFSATTLANAAKVPATVLTGGFLELQTAALSDFTDSQDLQYENTYELYFRYRRADLSIDEIIDKMAKLLCGAFIKGNGIGFYMEVMHKWQNDGNQRNKVIRKKLRNESENVCETALLLEGPFMEMFLKYIRVTKDKDPDEKLAKEILLSMEYKDMLKIRLDGINYLNATTAEKKGVPVDIWEGPISRLEITDEKPEPEAKTSFRSHPVANTGQFLVVRGATPRIRGLILDNMEQKITGYKPDTKKRLPDGEVRDKFKSAPDAVKANVLYVTEQNKEPIGGKTRLEWNEWIKSMEGICTAINGGEVVNTKFEPLIPQVDPLIGDSLKMLVSGLAPEAGAKGFVEAVLVLNNWITEAKKASETKTKTKPRK